MLTNSNNESQRPIYEAMDIFALRFLYGLAAANADTNVEKNYGNTPQTEKADQFKAAFAA